MTPSIPIVDPGNLTREIASLLPEYLPGVSTGPAAPTEGRSCWIEAWKTLLGVCGRRYGMEVVAQPEEHSALARQLTVYWKRGDGILFAFLSGWGDRQELEQRFLQLEIIKAPQKAILYSCTKWQVAVLEQLEAALLRYPHHIEGEQYLMLNLLGSAQTLAAHSIVIPRNGTLQSADIESLQPLAGSPFHWGGRLHQGDQRR
jgi:hypothetical protein